MGFPRITVVTPSYNQGQFIEKTIQSVLGQGYPDVEHIIVDGGSTDGTLAVLKKYRHLRWVSEPDRGQADAINKGLRMATGDVLAWINSDDYYLPGAFERLAKAYEGARKLDVVMGDVSVVDEGDRLIARRRVIPYHYRTLLFGTNYIHQPAVFFTKEALEKVGYLDESLHYVMDWELWLRFGRAGLAFKLIRAPLACLRWHSGAKSVALYSQFAADSATVRNRYWRRGREGSRFCSALLLTVLRTYYALKVQAVRLALRGAVDRPLRFVRAGRRGTGAGGSAG